jgi:tetratricopeptide (TPR) repeat protein
MQIRIGGSEAAEEHLAPTRIPEIVKSRNPETPKPSVPGLSFNRASCICSRFEFGRPGRELGVRYVLEGSVQRAGKQVRVNAQLIDADTDAHLWAERFDRDMGDLFALQNEITGRIARALNSEIVTAEAARPADHLDALDYIFRGRAASSKRATRDTRAEAIGLFERALALDPRSVEAQSALAGTLAGRAMDGMTNSAVADIARAESLADQALAASPHNPLAHNAKGQVLRAQA